MFGYDLVNMKVTVPRNPTESLFVEVVFAKKIDKGTKLNRQLASIVMIVNIILILNKYGRLNC